MMVGLMVDHAGFPLEIGCYEGNKAETATIIPIIRQFQERHSLVDIVVVASPFDLQVRAGSAPSASTPSSSSVDQGYG